MTPWRPCDLCGYPVALPAWRHEQCQEAAERGQAELMRLVPRNRPMFYVFMDGAMLRSEPGPEEDVAGLCRSMRNFMDERGPTHTFSYCPVWIWDQCISLGSLVFTPEGGRDA